MLKRLILALALARAPVAAAQADTLTAGQTKTTAVPIVNLFQLASRDESADATES
jgi:hypothetical protein